MIRTKQSRREKVVREQRWHRQAITAAFLWHTDSSHSQPRPVALSPFPHFCLSDRSSVLCDSLARLANLLSLVSTVASASIVAVRSDGVICPHPAVPLNLSWSRHHLLSRRQPRASVSYRRQHPWNKLLAIYVQVIISTDTSPLIPSPPALPWPEASS